MEEASEVIAAAQAVEADALLTAAAARAEAAEAVADSERIQSAAAADAVRALIAAGLVEEAAAHEAVTALTAAGLIVAAADEAAADAVAEDAATVETADEVTAASLAESLATIAAADEVAGRGRRSARTRVRAASITMAEAQVLRYLPELPFSVIADKLGISRSAAKERAARLYRRLGVHSRDEAVGRARFPRPDPRPRSLLNWAGFWWGSVAVVTLLSGRFVGSGRGRAVWGLVDGRGAGGRLCGVAGRGGLAPAAWSGGQNPGSGAAGQAVAEQVAQVQRGGAAFEPGVVRGYAAVAEFDPASSPGRDLGDGAFDVGPVCRVVLAEPGGGGPVCAGGAQQAVVFVQAQGAAVFGGGAPLTQRAAPAGGTEDDMAARGDRPGDAGRAGDQPGLLIDGEVVHGEAVLDGRLDRLGLDHRLVTGAADRITQLTGPVGRVAVPGQRAVLTGIVRPGGLSGHEFRRDRRVPVLLAHKWLPACADSRRQGQHPIGCRASRRQGLLLAGIRYSMQRSRERRGLRPDLS